MVTAMCQSCSLVRSFVSAQIHGQLINLGAALQRKVEQCVCSVEQCDADAE